MNQQCGTDIVTPLPPFYSVQYLSQVEMFSLEVRSLGVAVVSVIHFLAQFGSSRSVNPIVNSGGPWSLFLFFFIMSLASLLVSGPDHLVRSRLPMLTTFARVAAPQLQFVFFMMPEVSGYPLEHVRDLFDNKSWYLIGCTQNRPLRRKEAANHEEDMVPRLEIKQDEAQPPMAPIGSSLTKEEAKKQGDGEIATGQAAYDKDGKTSYRTTDA